MLGSLLAALVALAYFGIGLTAVVAPKFGADAYGIRTEDPAALAAFRATGARDMVLGLLVGGFALRQMHEALAVVILVSSAIAVADFMIVARSRGGRRASLAIHAAGFVGLVIIWAALRAGV